MTMLVIEPFTDVAAWTAQQPGGTPSSEVAITGGGPARRAGPSARVAGVTGAGGHFVERQGAAADLSAYRDVRLWVRSDRVADGSPSHPFFLEVRLGSEAAPIGSPANLWHRFLPVPVAGAWQPVPIALDDLPPVVRSAVTRLRLTCVDGSAGFALHVDRIAAVRDEMLADVDAALQARLGGRVEIGGTPVPAFLAPLPDPPPVPPYFRLNNYDVAPDRGRSPSTSVRTDYTEGGFRLRPPSLAYDIFYAVEAVATDRSGAARMVATALAELVPESTLDCDDIALRVEWVPAPLTAADTNERVAQPVIHVKVATSQSRPAEPEAAVPVFNVVGVEVDQRASA